MVVFVAMSVYLGKRRLRGCTVSNQGNTHLSEKLVQRERVNRRHDVTIDSRRETDVVR